MPEFVDGTQNIFKDTDANIWGAEEERKGKVISFSPTLLLDIFGSSTYLIATRDFHDSAGNFYKGDIQRDPEIIRELDNISHGVEKDLSVTFTIADISTGVDTDSTWKTITDSDDLRGDSVKVQKNDPIDGTTFVMRGKVVSYSFTPGFFHITIEMRDDDILKTVLPQKVVTTDTFTVTALDVGQPINICFGAKCRDVPLWNIKNDTAANQYDYLIGYGTIEGLWTGTGLGVKRNGILVDSTEYTIDDGSGAPTNHGYAGYATIRFSTEQRNFAGGFHKLTADVKGLELGGATAERNFATIIKNILNDSTWGLNDSVDATSFTNAASALDTIGDMYCDGAVVQQMEAATLLDYFLRPARATLERGADGEWEITIDQAGVSIKTFDDAVNCHVLSVSVTPTYEAIKTAKLQYGYNSSERDKPYYEMEVAVNAFGEDRIFTEPFVYEHDTAERVLSYIKNRSLYSDETVEMQADMDGRLLSVGDIITLTASRFNISSETFKIQRARKTLTNFVYTLRAYSASIYTNEVITSPSDHTPPTTGVYGPAADLAVWETKTADFTAERNHRYDIDTNTVGEVEMTLPADPATDDIVMWNDLKNNFGTNNLIVRRNSLKIMGQSDDMTCDNDDESGYLRYSGATDGWILL